MALKFALPFPIFAPQKFGPSTPNPYQEISRHRSPTIIRFSRWNNANAERFNERRRAQQEIEDEIRRERRFESATRIAQIHESYDAAAPSSPADGAAFRSTGTPSSPSSPSIPGRKSKYSVSHPAFKKISKTQRTVRKASDDQSPVDRAATVALTDDGVTYVIDGAPFEFKYSYTETPKLKPLRLREPPYAPFGPTTMARPWTGRAPLPPSKKKLKEFDSFKLPPPGKKGVKPVQAPGPYVAGTGPKYVMSREEILGEPLSKEEVRDLVKGCMKSQRQLNMGRDGLTHNMLENIHAHWKRRRVCKIKCKGVCTVDMDNVKQQLEERTGGKIICSTGGVIYLFRGRNYNYKTRPRFPLMLWRPVSPVYPRLVKRVPEGLTLEEATEMRKKGRKLIPICKLGKNGVYCDLVKNVREAFEACELARINCQGMNGSDYRKIGAKLKDLVPCVLISFEHEHILMWRGRDWKSSFPTSGCNSEPKEVSSSAPSLSENEEVEYIELDLLPINSKDMDLEESENEYVSKDIDAAEETASDISVSDQNEVEVTTVNIDYASTLANILDESENENGGAADETGSDISIAGQNELEDTKRISMDDVISLPNILEESEKESLPESSAVDYETDSDISIAGQNEWEDTRSINMNGYITIHNISAISESSSSADKGDDEPEIASSDLEKSGTLEKAEKPRCTLEAARESERVVSPATEGVLLLLNQAIENGAAMILEEYWWDADVVYKKSVSFAQTAPAGPMFRQGPRRVAVKKAEKIEEEVNSSIVHNDKRKNRQKGDAKVIRRKKDYGVEEHSNAVPHGSLRVDELAKLLA
ncbi:hypothetical protein SAY87_008741 [Trapa incisa]|uniref:CRM domain-containing protein n=1 Tax=Trapa incisa TaxID=236973 RepID=A0AAN7PWE0_9MYRT|nr:hypothetical protein SAY87_008741 [Trapa incisa]